MRNLNEMKISSSLLFFVLFLFLKKSNIFMLVVIEFMEYKNKENEMNVQIFENKSNAKER